MKNGLMFQAYEWHLDDNGDYYMDMISKIGDLKELGVTAVWLPPVTKATGTNDTGYGIYDLWDLGEFDQKGNVRTKYGTKDQLLQLISELHKNDISVYADVVLNHKASADRTERFNVIKVDENDRNKAISDVYEIEGWTAFDFDNRNNEYSDFKWNFNHFTGIDFDNRTGETGVYKIIGENKGWSQAVSNEKGNFDYLMFADIDHAHPDVIKELKSWITWFIEQLNLDGIRFDALKHIDRAFMEDYIKYIKANTREDFYLLGEYWENDAKINNDFLDGLNDEMDLFDTVLHFNLLKAAREGSRYDLRKIFDNSLVLNQPSLAVTFVDNHDSQPGQSLQSFVDDWFKEISYGLILLRKDGYPCIFYGDYYGMKGNGPSEGLQDKIKTLAKIRQKFAHGSQDDYFELNNCIGWVRHGVEEFPNKCAVIISNGDMNTLEMFVGTEQASKVYADYTGNNAEKVVIREDGFGDFMVGPGSISVWVEDGIEL